MVVDFSWTGGFIVGLNHTDTAIVETAEEEFEFCQAIMLHLGLFTVSFLFL